MKKASTFRNIFRFSLILVIIFSFLNIFSSCKQREEDPHENVNVQFRVSALPTTKLKAIVTQVGTVQSTKFYDPTLPQTVTNWSSETMIVNTKEGAVHLSATAQGENTDSQVTVSIWINGEKKAENIAKGINIVAKTVVDFNK